MDNYALKYATKITEYALRDAQKKKLGITNM